MKTEWDYTNLADAYLRRPEYAPSAISDLLAAIGQVLDNGARKVTIHLPYDKGNLLDLLYREAKVESVEYAGTIDVVAVCNPKAIGAVKAYVEGWVEPKEPWE